MTGKHRAPVSVEAAQRAHELLDQALATRARLSVTENPAAFDDILYGDTGPVPVVEPAEDVHGYIRGALIGILAVLCVAAGFLGHMVIAWAVSL